jgi:hypothetical protein
MARFLATHVWTCCPGNSFERDVNARIADKLDEVINTLNA